MTHLDRERKSDRRKRETEIETEFQTYDKGQTRVVPFSPLSDKQFALYKTILENKLSIAIGPAGTAKSYIAAAAAIKLLIDGDIDEIIVTRNPVPTGYTTGLKPGEMGEKMAPWLSPILNNLKKCCESPTGRFGFYNYLREKGKIKFLEIESVKGSNFENAFVIIEEAQECDLESLKNLSTRIADNCWVYFDGDIAQGNSRLKGSKDFQRYIDGIRKMNRIVSEGQLAQQYGEDNDWVGITIPVFEMTKEDCVRSGYCRWMLEMFEVAELV